MMNVNASAAGTPAEVVNLLLDSLPPKSRRMRDIVERRFGLKRKERATLEAVGRIYRITRERVRQIEADALRRLRPEAERLEPINAFLQTVEQGVRDHGEVISAGDLTAFYGAEQSAPHFNFLLYVSPRLKFLPETEELRPRWTVSEEKAAAVEKLLERAAERLGERRATLSEAELDAVLGAEAQSVLGESENSLPPRVTAAYRGLSKIIRRNPYGQYGLVSWPLISPRGIKDKAYAAMLEYRAPMHFKDVASAIDRAAWTRRKAHPQTVHNELIKDSRFVLVGRGIYGLRDWGYEPGTVRDVLVSILQEAGGALHRDEIIKFASEKRLVKPQTILLNLQDRSLFKRTADGKYTLV